MNNKKFWVGVQAPSHAGQKIYLRAPVQEHVAKFLDNHKFVFVSRIKRVGLKDGELVGWMFPRDAVKDVIQFLEDNDYTNEKN